MQQTARLETLSIARKLSAPKGASAIRRTSQTDRVDTREAADLITGRDDETVRSGDTYAQRLMKQLSGFKVS